MYWKDWNTHSCKIPLLSFQRSFFIHPNISLFYRVISLFYRELSFILLFPPFEVDCSSFYLISCCFVEDCQKSPKPGICRGSSSDETNEIVNFGTLKLNFKWSQQNAALPASKEDGKWKWMRTKKKCITRKVLNWGLASWKCETLISAKKLFCWLLTKTRVACFFSKHIMKWFAHNTISSSLSIFIKDWNFKGFSNQHFIQRQQKCLEGEIQTWNKREN